MSIARPLSNFWSRKVVGAYNAAWTAIREARLPSRYQPLAQDTYSVLADVNLQLRKRASSRWRKIVVFAAVILIVLVVPSVYFTYHGMVPSGISLAADASRPAMSKDTYMEAVLRDPVEGLIDPDPIRKKCSKTKFQDGLIWHCDTIVGGIGNVANMWLNCVRYAIEAGGAFGPRSIPIIPESLVLT